MAKRVSFAYLNFTDVFSQIRHDSAVDLGFLPRHICPHELFNFSHQLSETNWMASNFQGKQLSILASTQNHMRKRGFLI